MTLSTQTVLAWTPGSSNPGVDLCLEGARDQSLKKHKVSEPSKQNAQEGFLMYTQAQIDVLKKYKKALQDYNEGKINFKEYVVIALPLWDEINILFDMNQKSS